MSEAQKEVKRSLYFTQDEILSAIKELHCPDGFEADLTYGNGSFWKSLSRPRLCFDITPVHAGVIQADSARLPVERASLSSAPPCRARSLTRRFSPTFAKGGRTMERWP